MEKHIYINTCSIALDQQNFQLIFGGYKTKVSSSGSGTDFTLVISRVDPVVFSVYHCMKAIHVPPTVM